MRAQSFLGELKRRKVFQVTSVYLVAAWGLSAGAADIFEVLGFPVWASRYFVIGLFSITPIVIVVAWVFELSKSGIQRDLGPVGPVDQTTILASRPGAPVLAANWLGTKYSFAQDFVVGRDDSCALQIVDPMISRQHAKFSLVNGRWRVEDLGSANGIEIDGQKQVSAWLTPHSSVRFYPDGPALKLTVGSVESAVTMMAQQPETKA
jgi:FHA domain-containing protein